MARKRNVRAAKVKKPGVVQVDYRGCKNSFTKGDEVIVVQPTETYVRSRVTGKILGNREYVIGRGVVSDKHEDVVEIHFHTKTSQMNMVNGTANLIVKKVDPEYSDDD